MRGMKCEREHQGLEDNSPCCRFNRVLHGKSKLGRFILASNDLNIDPDTILSYYKGQQEVERGFRFLKDKSFRVAEVYLKKPS